MSWLDSVEAWVSDAIKVTNPALYSPAKRLGLQLEQFRNRDFRSMEREVKDVFKNTKLELRFVPLAYRVSLDGAGQYPRAPWRDFAGIGETQAGLLRAVYDELGVDQVLLDAEQAGVLQQSYLLAVLPDGAGKLRVVPFLPHQVAELVIRSPFAAAAGDVCAADRVVLVLPLTPPEGESALAAELLGTTPWCVRIVLTRETAYLEYPDGVKVGLYNEDLSNPLGRVPVVGTRTAKPSTASWFPEPAHDVLSAQIGIVLALSDCEKIMRSQAHVKVLLAGMGAAKVAKEVEDTPDGFIVVDEPDVQAVQLALNPAIEKYLRAAETVAYYISQYRYLRPEAYQASIVTGAARRADAEGFVENQARQEQRVLPLERELCALIVDSYNAHVAGALKLSQPKLEVVFRYTRAPENELQRMQGRTIALQQGLLDGVRDVAIEERISMDQARETVLARLKAWRELFASAGDGKTPGLDKLAPEGTTTTAPKSLAVETVADVQKAALNGAQVQSLQSVVQSAANGEIPVNVAREMILASFPISEKDVDRMLAPLKTFKPPAPTP